MRTSAVKPKRHYVRCKCGERVLDTFGSKLSHVLTDHHCEIIEDAILSGGDSIRDKSFHVGRELRERFFHAKQN